MIKIMDRDIWLPETQKGGRIDRPNMDIDRHGSDISAKRVEQKTKEEQSWIIVDQRTSWCVFPSLEIGRQR